MELNASGLSKRLALSGYDSRVQKIHAGKGSVYRVMLGPNESREAAERLRDKLARERQLKGIVINSPD
jgi:DedD protein